MSYCLLDDFRLFYKKKSEKTASNTWLTLTYVVPQIIVVVFFWGFFLEKRLGAERQIMQLSANAVNVIIVPDGRDIRLASPH